MKGLLWCAFCFCLLQACGKIELADDAPVPPADEIVSDDTLTVEQARRCPVDTIIAVKGYIVGYIAGTSITSGALFECPMDEANTNMLIADSPDETDYMNCLPVKLENSGNFGYRAPLNMYDHPENYRRRILLSGLVGNYFRIKGLTRVYNYNWLVDNNPDIPSEDETDTPRLVDKDTLLVGR